MKAVTDATQDEAICDYVFTEQDVKDNIAITKNIVAGQKCGWIGPFEKLVSSDDNSV